MSFSINRKEFVRQRFASFVWLALVLFSVLITKAERLPVKTYTVSDGLLRDNVNKIKQDSRGFLWFCTLEGVSRFDGYGFTNFTTNEGLPDRHVNDFLETRNGDYWIATDAGLARLNPAGLSSSSENPLFTVFLPENPKAKKIKVLFEDEQNQIWAGTSDGLYKLNEQLKLEAVPLGDKSITDALEVTSIIEDRSGALWIGTLGDGLFRLLPDGRAEQFTTADGGLPNNNVASLLEDKDGRIWVGLRLAENLPSGLCLLVAEPEKNQKIVERFYSVKDGLPANWISSLYQSRDGKFWVGTIKGLCLWQGENNKSVCKIYNAENDLCDTETWSVTEDKDDNLWTGTRCGAKKLRRYGFTTYTTADGLDNLIVSSVFENKTGEIFATVNKSQINVSRFNGEKFDLVKPNFPENVNSFGWGWKQTVWQDSAGDWWFPTKYGLYRFTKPARFEDLEKTRAQKIETGAKGNEIFRLFEDSRGDIWIATTGTAHELLRWERATNVWRNYTREAGFSERRIGAAFAEDKSGNLWISTGEDDSALIRYRDGQFKIFTQAEGAPPDWTRDLLLDRDGKLWLANTAIGLLRLDDTNGDNLNFVKYTTADGLSSNGVYCLTQDAFGRIYVGTGRGVDRLNPATGQIENFTTADGLPDSDVQIAYHDQSNTLWFGTWKGLARFVPEPPRERESPKILITGLQITGIAQPVSILGESQISRLELNADQRQITINFVGLGASPGERLKYEYRLGESDWTPTAERTVNFANLASGAYRFEVRAETADRIYSQTPAVLSFKIAAPVWQRWWFIVSILALAILAIYGFYRFRLMRLLEMERMRTRIATDLHDDIGANLTRISLLSEVAKQKSENGKPSNLLTSIADIARESVASMNDIVWAISPDHDSLLDLTRRMRGHAEEVFTYRDIDLEFHASTKDEDLRLSVGVRRDVLLIFKEAVNNAARHSDCLKVEIDFRADNGVLFLRIKDNGKGFETVSENDGQGLRSMTRRARALGGNLRIGSRAGDGTTVEFELALPKASQI